MGKQATTASAASYSPHDIAEMVYLRIAAFSFLIGLVIIAIKGRTPTFVLVGLCVTLVASEILAKIGSSFARRFVDGFRERL